MKRPAPDNQRGPSPRAEGTNRNDRQVSSPILPKENDGGPVSPLLVTTSWPLGSAECLPRPTRSLRAIRASVRLQASHGTRDQKAGTRHRLRVPCPLIYALLL